MSILCAYLAFEGETLSVITGNDQCELVGTLGDDALLSKYHLSIPQTLCLVRCFLPAIHLSLNLKIM